MTESANSFAILDNINAIVLVADARGNIIFANKAIKHILGYDPEEVLGNGWWELTSHENNAGARKAKTAAMAVGTDNLKDRHLFEHLLPTKDGREVWTQWTNTRTAEGFLVGIAQDITEKKKLEKKLIRKNREKELLLQEIHHRVKNNLQIIISLLNLQFNNITNKQVLEALSNVKDRINSMALIHTKLYQSKNLAYINFGEYLMELADSIAASYSPNYNINCLVASSQVGFNIDLSTSLGLIITELLTNAYKHAFKGREKGQIQIELTNTGNSYQLIIADDGIGLINDKKNSQSLGLEIVKALIEQIDGSLTTTSNNGLKYLIIFEGKSNLLADN
ncbi:MAG: PAS domain S-box protein [Flavobacteriales bacterium]|nr:PAS domain S-box protein [Flavobacteriales bacterium]